MRLFVALDIPADVREQLTVLQRQLKPFAPQARWSRTEGLHVTLKFLGEVPEPRLPEVITQLRTVQAPTLDFSVRSLGFFPDARAARVFWAGIESGPELAALAHQVDKALARAGVAPEEHAFHPHLTLARTGSGRPQRDRSDAPNAGFAALQAHLSSLPMPDFGTITAREFLLYESKLGPGGSIYTPLERFALQP